MFKTLIIIIAIIYPIGAYANAYTDAECTWSGVIYVQEAPAMYVVHHEGFNISSDGFVTAEPGSEVVYGVWYKVTKATYYYNSVTSSFTQFSSAQGYFGNDYGGVKSVPSDCSGTCEDGQVWLPDPGQCVYPCPSGQELNEQGECEDICPPGQIYVGTVCIDPPSCTDGQEERINQCNDFCGGAEKVSHVTCYIDENMNLQSNCVCNEPLYCGPNMHEENGICVDNEPPVECAPGQTLVNGECVDDNIVCPAGQHEENGICVDSPDNFEPSPPDPNPQVINLNSSHVTNRETVQNPDGSTTETTTETETKTENGEVVGESTTTISRTIAVDPITGAVTETVEETEETTEEDYQPPTVAGYLAPEREFYFDGLNSQLSRLSNQGPVKMVQDIRGLFQNLIKDPQAPSFTFVVWHHPFTVSLASFDVVATICRTLFMVLILVSLVVLILRQWRAA